MLVDIRRNGYGLQYGSRFPGKSETYNPWFDNAGHQFATLMEDRSQVLGGEPGAGKSHIAEDVFNAAYSAGMMSCMVACHINRGGMAGRSNTEEVLATARDAGGDCVVVVDNLDYMIYTGSGKKRATANRVNEYADFISGALQECKDADCLVMATTHSDEWRVNHSQAPENAWEKYTSLVTALGGIVDFPGTITEVNAERILLRRNIVPHLANVIARDLSDADALLFRQAHHIDPVLYEEEGIGVAIAAVDYLKDQKIHGGA